MLQPPTCLQLARASSKASVHRTIVARTAEKGALAKTAGAAVFARTAGKEALAKTAGAAVFVRQGKKTMQRLRGQQYLHALQAKKQM